MQILLAALGFLLSLYLCRKAGVDRFTRNLILAAYFLRILGTFFLFEVSLRGLPFLERYQLGGGFWNFAWDSKVYDLYGGQVAQAWRAGNSLPSLGPEWPFVIYTAILYLVLGAKPLCVSLLNSWYLSCTAILVFLIIRRSTDDIRSARRGTALILFWPSLVLWSTQLLKESFLLFLILAAFHFIFRYWERADAKRVGTILSLAAVSLSVFLLSIMRGYIGAGFAAATGFLFMVTAIRRFCGRPGNKLSRFAPLFLAVCLPVWIGIFFSSKEMLGYLNPSSPKTMIRELPGYLGLLREGILYQSGATTMDPGIRIKNLADLISYAPRGLTLLFFAPFPWEWTGKNSAKSLQLLAGMEAFLMILFIPAMAKCGAALFQKRGVNNLYLFFFILLIAIPLSVAVPNLGTLFRLRLQLFVPLIVLIASTNGFITGCEKPSKMIF